MPDLRFSTLQASDLFAIEPQTSQATVLGFTSDLEQEEAEAIAAQRIAWTAREESGRIVACFGINEPFPGGHQGFAWSILAPGIGAAHLQLTRFCKAQITGSGLARVDLMARAADVEHVLASRPQLDSGMAVAVAMCRPTPECRWATLLGFTPAHVLRRYGPDCETFMLFEWFGVAASVPVLLEAAA